jgi:hypothetical protein
MSFRGQRVRGYICFLCFWDVSVGLQLPEKGRRALLMFVQPRSGFENYQQKCPVSQRIYEDLLQSTLDVINCPNQQYLYNYLREAFRYPEP